ncbi:MAG: choice-of-anchor Q domain-containing protein [Planctomycetota bacterium]
MSQRVIITDWLIIDTGTAEGAPATDIQGRNRNGKPDIGAYETGS